MTVIKIEHISKMYRLGMVGRTTLKDDLSKLYRGIFKGGKSPEEEVAINNRASGSSADFIWSLKDINLEVQEGEVLGIIGKNGAGKSTLLKILSRVTKPTSGTIRIKGRIASLLEVGTGFHPELTGRENIFLNGAILGMTKDEIRRKFDEIVDFSGVGTFLDTPVKRYSSGMYVRLAFAVAAHLEPEILVVDEVLAVGDADFQKKCLGKMKSVSGEGRTVLFVSHNMDAVNALCSKVMMLEYGQKVYEGDTKDGVSFYLRSGAEDNYGEVRLDTYQNNAMRSGKKDNLRISAIRTLNKSNEVSGRIFQNETLTFEMDFECLRLTAAPELGFAIKNAGGTQLSFFVSDWLQAVRNIAPGNYTYEFRITGLNLVPGEYTLDTWVRPQMNLPADDYIETALNLRVIQSEENQSVNYSFYVKHGAVIMDAKGQLK